VLGITPVNIYDPSHMKKQPRKQIGVEKFNHDQENVESNSRTKAQNVFLFPTKTAERVLPEE
jgi:hypothetical protein